MYPKTGEILTCEQCGKTVEASQEMEYWLCLSEVKAEEESNWSYLCSVECLKSHITEPLSRDSLITSMWPDADAYECECPNCRHKWTISGEEWKILSRSIERLPNCPKCGGGRVIGKPIRYKD